jgi:hypothetical protein
MRIKRVRLPGRFVEAYLYYDFAWLFSKDGVVRAFDLAKYCTERLNGEGNAAAALFSDNRGLPAQRRPDGQESPALKHLLDSDAPIDVSAPDVDTFSHIFTTSGRCRSILDVRFYNGRAFVGSDNGILQFTALGREDLLGQPLGRSNSGLSDQRVSDRPARQIQGRYGAVAAACGSSGGILGVGAAVENRGQRMFFQEFAERSFGVEFNGNAVSSLSGSTSVELYAVESRSRPAAATSDDGPGNRSEVAGITGRGFVRQDLELNRLIGGVAGATKTFLFKETLWVLASDGFYRFKLTVKNAVTSPKLAGRTAKPPARVLSTSTSKAGMIVESDDKVYLLDDHHWRIIMAEPVHSVRGYLQSKRYKHVVTSVMQERVELTALI